MAIKTLTFSPDQVASTDGVKKSDEDENVAEIEIRKTFAEVTVDGGVERIEVTVDDSELKVNPATGENNFLEKSEGDQNTTITSMTVFMNDGTKYVGGSDRDFRKQDTSDTPDSFNPGMGDNFVATNGAVDLVNADTNEDAPNSGSCSFKDLAGQNLIFSTEGDWSTTTINTRLLDTSGDTSDSTGDGLFNAGDVICFARGTRIKTDRGAVTVEDLAVGDLVETVDNGFQPIRWVRSDRQPLEEAEVDAKPVQIKAGALGPGLPSEDLIVSAQHRILVGGAGQFDTVFDSEALAPAKSLTGAPGIRHMKGKKDITWVHFACDRHEVVIANGCQSESLLLGPMALNSLAAAERRAVTELFGPAPVPGAALNGPPARSCLKVGVARRRIAAQKKANTSLAAGVPQTKGRGFATQEMTTPRM